MSCSACGHDNPTGNRFCGGCGAALERLCRACQHSNPPDHRFCGGCGAALEVASSPAGPALVARDSLRAPRDYTPKHLADKILQSKSALEGERKQVTVLFADVKGSMELAEQIGAEPIHAVLDRFFSILAEGVHRFEGTINQYTGDGIMALFGAPITHEDHAQRACYAALALRDALREFSRELKRQHGLEFATRIGIHSGEVVVGRIGDDLRMDYTAQGHTVGLAQRMESLASGGSIYVSDRTAAIVGGYFALDDLGEFQIKGASAPLHVFELCGIGALRTRFDRSRARGLSKFVGRAQEMGALDAALDQALAGRGQVFGVVANAGTGKSRLCFEFVESCRARGIMVRATTGVAHGKAVPLLPVLEFYREVFGITERDDARAARQKIAGGVVQNDETLVTSLPLIFDFLGVPDPERPVMLEPGPERRHALLSVLKRLALARSRREPAVILFEDLHWIDDATELFLENLVDAADASRTLIVVNFRPEYRADWMRRSYYQQLALAPLDARAFAEMLGDTLGHDPSLRDVSSAIHARSGGNPFFAEEIALSLIESGALVGTPGAYRLAHDAASFEIPASVQLVLAARIDRLEEREKNVLQTASVIGREFSLVLLRRVAHVEADALDDALRALVQAEFLHETALYPEAEYAFKHPLTQEVALGSQLGERRAFVHEGVAKALVEIHACRLDEHAALIAHHFEAAGNPAEAVRWHERAAAWLEGRDLHAERHHWMQLLELLGNEPATTELARAGLRACNRLMYLATFLGLDLARAEALFHRGRALALRLDEPALEAGLIAFFARLAMFAGQSELARGGVEEALALAPRVADPDRYAELIQAAAVTVTFVGRYSDALEVVETALASGKVTSTTPVALARLTAMHASTLTRLGRLAAARSQLDRAAELVSYNPAQELVLLIELFSTLELAERGYPEGSLERIAVLVARADETETHNIRSHARIGLAQAHLFAGRPDAALEAVEAGLGISSETGVNLGLNATFTVVRARVLLAQGEVVAARELIERIAATSLPTAASKHDCLVALAQVLVASDLRGERERIESSLTQAATLSEKVGSPGLQAVVCTERAHLARGLGDEAGWERELREALRIYTEMDATGWMERISEKLASLIEA